MLERFKDRVAIVTGGTSGIGRATAIELADQGAQVVVAGRRSDLGEQVVEEIRSRGRTATFVRTDVCETDSVQALVRTTIQRYGRLDCAFNNAGIPGESFKPVAEQSEESWDRVVATNLKGVWLCMKYEIPEMLRCGGGSIVNTASIFALAGSDFGISPYIASKHGVVGITRAAAMEYARRNLRVNAVCPGLTLSEMTAPALRANPEEFEKNVRSSVPMGRIAEAIEIARSVAWLCSSESSYMTGQTLCCDGGWLAR